MHEQAGAVAEPIILEYGGKGKHARQTPNELLMLAGGNLKTD